MLYRSRMSGGMGCGVKMSWEVMSEEGGAQQACEIIVVTIRTQKVIWAWEGILLTEEKTEPGWEKYHLAKKGGDRITHENSEATPSLVRWGIFQAFLISLAPAMPLVLPSYTSSPQKPLRTHRTCVKNTSVQWRKKRTSFPIWGSDPISLNSRFLCCKPVITIEPS
jgi:hypothetical protein